VKVFHPLIASDIDEVWYDTWTVTFNGKPLYPDYGSDQSPKKFYANYVVSIYPGDSLRVGFRTAKDLTSSGKYKYSYRLMQDKDSINYKYAFDDAAITAAKSIYDFDLTVNYEFEIASGYYIHDFVTTEITNEELAAKKIYTSLDEIFANPEDVYKIELYSKVLSDETINLFSILKNLRELSITSEVLTQIPGEFAELPLTKLTICESRIAKINFPDELSNLKTLKYFEYSRFQGTEIPAFVYKLENLEELKISEGPNLKIISSEIGNLKNLQKLTIYQCIIEELPESITNLDKLKYVKFNSTKLKSVKYLMALPSLTELTVFNAQIKSIETELLSCYNLENIDLGKNYISEIPDEFYNLKLLDSLCFWNNKLTTISEKIVSFENLKY